MSANLTVIIRCDHFGCMASLVPAYDGETIEGGRLIARQQGWIIASSPDGRHRGGVDLCPRHTAPQLAPERPSLPY